MEEKICVVLVTYNRKELLIKCLNALKKQTQHIHGIYIIDNDSADKTPELLFDNTYIKKLPPKKLINPWEKEFEIKNSNNNQCIKLYYVRMHKNIGGAGGFHEGVKRAYEKGYDWLWLMDDDVKPTKNCLKEMLSMRHISRCIYPDKIDIHGNLFNWEPIFDPQSGSTAMLGRTSFKNKDFCFVNAGCFEGMLIHRQIISKIGYPDKRFFIVYDDLVYGFLASLYTNPIWCKKAKIIKLVNFNISSSIRSSYCTNSYSYFYYGIRNIFLVREYLKNFNFFFNAKNIWFIVSFILFRVAEAIFKNKSIKDLKLIFQGIIDGLNKKFGAKK